MRTSLLILCLPAILYAAATATDSLHRDNPRSPFGSILRLLCFEDVIVDTNYKEFDETRIKTMIRQSNRSREMFYGATKGTARKASVRHNKPSIPLTDRE